MTAMTTILWLTAVVILGCVLFQRLSGKVGVPALLFFLFYWVCSSAQMAW